jgi:hypothetical protein
MKQTFHMLHLERWKYGLSAELIRQVSNRFRSSQLDAVTTVLDSLQCWS